MKWNSNETIKDWINYIDTGLIEEKENEELWHTRKTITLDSIKSLNYIRTKTDNLPSSKDFRFLKLVDLCELHCRNDYFHRFLGYRPDKYNDNEYLWWIDCWETIRLNNILHELGLRELGAYFSSSEGKFFKKNGRCFSKRLILKSMVKILSQHFLF